MATVKPHFDQYALDNLKRKLSDRVGYVVANKPDCAKIAQIISGTGDGYISESTLYRIFFQNDKNSAYKSTLDLVCRYVGFKDSFDFLEDVNSTRSLLQHNGINPVDHSHESLLYHCILQGSFKPLDGFFESIQEQTHQFKMSVMVSLFDSLFKANNLIKFSQHFVRQKFVREYFFEIGHDPKFRIKHYDKGYQHYLKGVDKSRGIQDLQEYVFANAVLFRHYFLSSKLSKAISHGKRLYKEIKTLESYAHELHCFPYIRFMAYKLWYMQLTQANQTLRKHYGNSLLDYCEKNKSAAEPYAQRMLFHTVAEVLIHSDLPETYHFRLKKIYRKEFQKFPDYVATKHLKYSLPYFEPNGMLHFRP